MPTPIELVLSSLLPTVSPLPPELVELSTSLLAQSRNKAATLKPEEEIARTYACCHIACQRLGHRLALEIAPPAPPVKPRVYQKLHLYFNSVLATPKAGRKKATEEDGEATQAGGKDSKAGKSTPVTRKRQAEEETSTPVSATKRLKRNEEAGVPHFVMPMIRHLCREFDTPDAAPHVYAGVESLLYGEEFFAPMQIGNGNPFLNPVNGVSREGQIPSTVVGVFDTVYGKLYPDLHHANKRRRKQQHTQMNEALETYCQDNAGILPFHSSGSGIVILGLGQSEDEACNEPALWKDMEWYQNIPTAEGDESGDDEISTRVEPPAKTPIRREKRAQKPNPDADEESGAAGLLPGLGTMFQPAIDWLSDERRAQYALWRADIGRRMASVKAQRA